MFSKRRVISIAALGLTVGVVASCAPSSQAAQPVIEVYRSASCGCCGGWIRHMRAAGFTVKEHLQNDLSAIKARLGVPDDLQSCHTATIDHYVIEGHVPAADVKTMLAERPHSVGLAVGGMPLGSPGMEAGGRSEPYVVTAFGPTGRTIFARH